MNMWAEYVLPKKYYGMERKEQREEKMGKGA
jgi:hypothetical protein